jgi:Family of unknown function (DUF5338)
MKTLSERIAEKALRSSAGRNDRNRAAFILVRAEVKKSIEDGYSLWAVWETLHEEGRITYTYQTFRRYAHALLSIRFNRPLMWTSK